MCFRLVCLLIFVSCLAAASFGKSDSCQSTEVAVQLLDLNRQAAPAFKIADFRATSGKSPVNLKSIKFDDGPRRVVLVFDRDKKLSSDTLKAEELVLQVILSSARQNDQFALITARGSERIAQFTGNHAALLQALSGDDQSGSNAKDGVLDAVLKAVGMFGTSQSGDAIIVIAADVGGHHSTDRKSVMRTLLQHQIRLFGIALGPIARRSAFGQTVDYWPSAGGPPSSVAVTTFEQGDQNFHPLTMVTGGFVLEAMNTGLNHDDKLKDPTVESRIKSRTNTIFNFIKTYYRMEIEAPPQGSWQLGLSEQSRKKAPAVVILYPHELWPCFEERQSSASSR